MFAVQQPVHIERVTDYLPAEMHLWLVSPLQPKILGEISVSSETGSDGPGLLRLLLLIRPARYW
jgi:hypothetical protein